MHCSFLVNSLLEQMTGFLKVPISGVLSEDPLNLAGSRASFEQMTSI